MQSMAAGAAQALRRRCLLEHRLAPQGLTFLPENSLFVFGFWDASSLDPLMAAGLVRDTRAMKFCDARFSCGELSRFFGISPSSGGPLNRLEAADQTNVS